MRLLAGIGAVWLILASGSPSTSSAPANRERRHAPLACTLIALPGNSFTFVKRPEIPLGQFLTTLTPTATFQVTYVGFGSFPAAQAAFQAAVDIWSTLLVSTVPIKVRAEFKPLGANVLGSAGGQFVWRDFPGAPIAGTWYLDSIADRLAQADVNGNPADFDILASFNSTFGNWYFGINGATPANQYDFLSVVLHELAHGLGVSGSANVSGGVGSVGMSGFPTVYDRFVASNIDVPLLNFVNPSVALGTVLTSPFNPANPRGPGAYWNGPLGRISNGGLSARLYTPGTWSPGSSYSHLDENTYPAGNPNSLMTYAIAQAEAIHDPGPVTLGVLGDSGWISSGGLVRLAGFPAMYWVQNDRRYPVASDAVITAMQTGGVAGWNPMSVTTVPFLPGSPAPTFIATNADSNGLLIRQLSSTQVYLVENGHRRLFVTPEALAWNGVNWLPNVIDVSANVLASFTTGIGQNIHAIGEGESNPAIKQTYADAYARAVTGCGMSSSLGWPGTFAACLEFPQGAVGSLTASGASGVAGKAQNFGNETARLGALVNSQFGTFAVSGPILAAWDAIGGSGSSLGLPISDEYHWGALRRSDFEGGYISRSGTSTSVVPNIPTRTISLTGNLSFGTIRVGQIAKRTLSIGNSGSAALTVSSINYPAGFGGDWSGGVIAAGGSQSVVVTFTPTAVTSYGGLISVDANQTSGATTIDVSGAGTTRLITDLNGDGIGDLLLQEMVSTFVGAWLMDGAMHVSSFVLVYPADLQRWGVVGRADLNSDGIGDILLQDSDSTHVGALLLNGSGVPMSFVLVCPDNIGGWKVVGTTDLNGDGITDILLQNSASSHIAGWIMNGAGQAMSFVSVVAYDLRGWRVVATADLNSDGTTDIVLQDTDSMFVGGLIMSAGQPANFVPVYFGTTGTWEVVGSEDLNGDGVVDLVLQDSVSTHVGAFIMNQGGQPTNFELIYPHNINGWRVKGGR